MLIATYPHDQDITVCFDEEQHLTSMLIEPNNTSYWIPLNQSEESEDSSVAVVDQPERLLWTMSE